MTEPVLIHVVDDDDSMRASLLRLLEAAGYEACGYGSAGEFLLKPLPERPGCLLLDLQMPGPSGLDLQEALRSRGNELPVIFLTGHASVSASVRAMKVGAVDFLTKPFDRDALFAAIGRALELDRGHRAARAEAVRLERLVATLTPRERDVFELVAAGKLNKQIGAALGISERTVKAHRGALTAKLGIHSPAELGSLGERLRRLATDTSTR